MMKTYIFLISTLLCFAFIHSTSAQCELSIDPISGKKGVTYDYKNKSVFFSSQEGAHTLEIKFNFNGELNEYIPKGRIVNIKLSNDEILNLETLTDAAPVSSVVGQAIFSQYVYKMSLSIEELEKMAEYEAIFIRYPGIGDSSNDLDLSKSAKKLKKNLQAGAQCLKKQLL